MSALISSTFPSNPRACVVPLGNNDVFPNYYTNTSAHEPYARQAATARHFCGLDESTADLFSQKGYYNVTVADGKVCRRVRWLWQVGRMVVAGKAEAEAVAEAVAEAEAEADNYP